MILELRGLSCGYGRRKVLKDISLTVAAGDNLCLLGPNGVGKTTLFRTILGAIDPMGGEILVDGKSIVSQSRRHRARVMAYVPQAHTAPFPFHVMDVVLTGRTAHIPLTSAPSHHDEAVARAALERMDIADLAGRPYTELSGGERQLVLIARALAQEPRVLIMDEPSSHLDFGNQARLLSLIRDLVKEGDLAVLMSSHFPNHAFACATRVGLVKDGCLVALGSPDDVLTEESLEEIYGIPVRILEGDPETDPALKVCAARSVSAPNGR
jgi:iron complex transport system ATP-binding protein